MSQWDQRIREHSVWAEMSSLGPVIDSALESKELTPEDSAGLERLRVVLSFCGKRLAAAEPLITASGPLDEVAIGLRSAREELERYASDHNVAHIVSANANADRVLLPITQVPGAYSPEELGALVSISIDYRSLVEQNLSKVKATLDGFSPTIETFRAKLSELDTSIQTEQQKLAQITRDYQGQFSAAQEKRNQEYAEALRSAQQDFTKLVTEYQAQFSTAQDTRSREFTEAQTVRQARYDDLVKDYPKRLSEQDSAFTVQRNEMIRKFEADLASLDTEYQSRAKAILDRVQNHEKHVEELVGVIGNLGVTSGYLRTANRAQKAMWFWQTLTVLALTAVSALAYYTLPLLENAKGQFVWGAFAGRVLLLVSLGIIAAYSGHQGDKLFVEEKRNRKFALELEAIGPYLAPLPPDEQNKFRIEMGDRSFGREYESDKKVHRKSPVSLVDLLKSKESKEILELALDLAKKR
jgi:hypothetical protein